jgi:murein DD-endopeptidase MepM/ murein hydrolase activator NlpD
LTGVEKYSANGLFSEKLAILVFGGAFMSNNKKNFLGKFAGKGYYIALVLCAVAIGISGYLYYRNANGPHLENPEATVDVMNPNGTGASTTVPSTHPLPTKKPFKTGKPVDGEVVMDYSMDCLCYNPTTRDWRTHDGMDFAAAAGTAVRAAAEGTVYTIFEDDTLGMTIVIRHDNGYVTTYASLGKDLAVAVGDRVELGQTIGYVGCSALLETALGDHLHFSVTCDGVSVDPEVFFQLV